MIIATGSLHFSPIFKTHARAFGNTCKSQGHEVHYIFNENYKIMLSKEELEEDSHFFVGKSKDIRSVLSDSLKIWNVLRIKHFLIDNKVDIFYLHNIHPIYNLLLFSLITNKKIRVIQHIHEPYTPNKEVYGFFQSKWLVFFEVIQGMIIKRSNNVIISSDNGERLFIQRYKKQSKKILRVPLLYEDLVKSDIDYIKKKYVTFIGPPSKAKGSHILFRLCEYVRDKEIPYKIMIISREVVNHTSIKDNKNVEVFHRTFISDHEISEILLRTKSVFTPYLRAVQSSVVIMGFMHGTKVVGSDVEGLREVVDIGQTGYLLDLESDISEWNKKIIDIIERDDITISRKVFENNYSESNWIKFLKEVILDR